MESRSNEHHQCKNSCAHFYQISIECLEILLFRVSTIVYCQFYKYLFLSEILVYSIIHETKFFCWNNHEYLQFWFCVSFHFTGDNQQIVKVRNYSVQLSEHEGKLHFSKKFYYFYYFYYYIFLRNRTTLRFDSMRKPMLF